MVDRLSHLTTKKGNTGTTELIKGCRYPKSDNILLAFNQVQICQSVLKEYISDYEQVLNYTKAAKDIEIFNLIVNPTLNNLGAYMWSGFEDTPKDYMVNLSLLNEMIINRSNEFEFNKSEFIIFDINSSTKLNYINLMFRNLEHYIWVIVHRFHGVDTNSYSKELQLTTSFYNYITDYLFNVCRLLQIEFNNKKETVWNILGDD